MRAMAVYERMKLDTIQLHLLVVVRSAAALCAVADFFWTGDPRTLTAQSPSCRVTTANGDVQGALRGGTCTFLSIPYAAPPTGNLRWRPPQPRAPWAPITLDATLQRQCAQINTNTGAPQGVEDCLVLNVWAPAASAGAPLPVLVWLHTGGFQEVSANFPASDGSRFAAERNAIVVAPNYRLGPLGFLGHRELTREDANYPSSGNYGLADQRAALRWVRDHIAAFGGDPANVTLAGTSAGSTSATIQLASPSARGLFHRAIIESGYATSRTITQSEAEAQGDALAVSLGCQNTAQILSCLRAATSEQVRLALPIGRAQFLEAQGRVEWGPVVDGFEVPDQPRDLFRLGRFTRMPIIIGANADEGWTFVDRSFPSGLDAVQYERAVRGEFGIDADAILKMYPASAFPSAKDALASLTGDVDFVCEARRLARAAHRDGAAVFFYSLEYGIDEVMGGRAFHGFESNLVFGNNFAAPTAHVLNRADQSLFDTISTFWRRFMETGDPNPRGVPMQWPPYRPGPYEAPVDPSHSDRYFSFGERLGVSNYLRDSQCNFWEPFFFRSVRAAVPAAAR
jgi:para-nitrobenzyl esterase